jgi:phosphoglycolate phosphatase-like HAD superfamily hydrolase
MKPDIRCVILDFDGTVTNIRAETALFERDYPRFFGEELGRDVSAEWATAVAEVSARSPELGWMWDGLPAAPAAADPYILASCAAVHVLDALGLYPTEPERGQLLYRLYGRAYGAATRAFFRDDTARVLRALLESGRHVCFVTNSRTTAVTARLGSLGLATLPPVFGDAQKFRFLPSADPAFAEVPATAGAEGLDRPIHVARGPYFDVLRRIWRETDTDAAHTLVCGDIFELDLALPAALGTDVHLVTRDNTYAYEYEAVRALGDRGGVSVTLAAVLERLG